MSTVKFPIGAPEYQELYLGNARIGDVVLDYDVNLTVTEESVNVLGSLSPNIQRLARKKQYIEQPDIITSITRTMSFTVLYYDADKFNDNIAILQKLFVVNTKNPYGNIKIVHPAVQLVNITEVKLLGFQHQMTNNGFQCTLMLESKVVKNNIDYEKSIEIVKKRKREDILAAPDLSPKSMLKRDAMDNSQLNLTNPTAF